VFVSAAAVAAAYRLAPRLAYRRVRKDLDSLIDQDPTPRG
jgi:hypothetical protein